MGRPNILDYSIWYLIPGDAIKYETGKVYRYTYDTKVLFNDHFSRKETKAQQDVGLHLTMEFELMPIFQDGDVQMVKIQVLCMLCCKTAICVVVILRFGTDRPD